MKTITIKQPWAYLICSGIKDIENRTWNTKFRGKVLIHASARLAVPDNKIISLFTDEQLNEIELSEVAVIPYNTSAIIGSVDIVDCVKNHSSVWAEKDCYNWVLENPVLFENPIENVKGKLSFWEYKL